MNTTNNCQARCHRQADKGAILMVVLIVMIALLGLGMTGLFLTSGSIQMNTNINLRNQALVVAEAGIERARGILNNQTWVPPVPDMLKGSTSSADEVPTTANDCQGSARGAILLDQITPSCATTPLPANCTLQNVAYPSLVDRSSDLPASAGPVNRTTMGTYTVYIRQDQADCRMGNYLCDYAPANGTGGIDGGVGGGQGGTTGATTCTVPANIPAPNGSVVIRSEGLASDGKTRVVLEVTMTPSQGAAKAQNTPMSALCAAGANGCDDNSSVQTGIVVNSNAPQSPPPSNGGAGGAGGTVGVGGAPGTGGALGTGGTFVSGSGSGGNSSGGAGGGTGGSGTGGSGTGGSTTCPNGSCSKIAVMGVPGIWNQDNNGNYNATTQNYGNTKFTAWLNSHNNNCTQIGNIDIQHTTFSAVTDPLKGFTVLILLDLYHTVSDFTTCLNPNNIDNCRLNRCYRTDGNPGMCTGQNATHTSTAISADPYLVSGCPTTATVTGTATRSSTGTGTYIGNIASKVGTNTTQTTTGTITLTSTGTGTTTTTATVACTAPPLTSYNAGSQRVLADSEVSYIESWVKAGGGIATTSSYYYYAAEVANVNKILAKFNLAYGTTDPAGHIESILSGTNGGGVDVGKVTSSLNMFVASSPPFGFKTPVTLLQQRSGVPLYTASAPPPFPQYPLAGTGFPVVSATADDSCPIGNAQYAANCSYVNPSCTATNYNPMKKIGYYVDSIGSGGGRVVAWSDEWLTYDTVWNAQTNCGSARYQPDAYWDNVVRWLGHCN